MTDKMNNHHDADDDGAGERRHLVPVPDLHHEPPAPTKPATHPVESVAGATPSGAAPVVDILDDDSDDAGQSWLVIDGQVATNAELEELKNPSERAGLLGRFDSVRDWAGFHGRRLPRYLARLLLRSPVGAGRVMAWWAEWAFRRTAYADDRSTMNTTGRGDVTKLRKLHIKQVQYRVGFSALAILFGAPTGLAIALTFPVLSAAALLAGLLVLGWIGSPRGDQRVIERLPVRSTKRPVFDESLMMKGLAAAGGLPKDGSGPKVLQPPARTRTGWEAIVVLGVQAETVISSRAAFAAAIEHPINCVWLSSDSEESAGWLRMVVTRKSLRRTKTPPWPLKGKTFNYFTDQVPVGVDELGEPVTARKAYASSVTGGVMGSGKTVGLINDAAAHAADARVELHFYDLKGGIDWEPFKPIAHFYRSGSDAEDHRAVLADLVELNRRMDARFRTLKGLPENMRSPKTNDRLASIRQLDLHPIVIFLDETQEAFEFADQAKEYLRLISRLVKKGRAVAITVVAGTQEVKKATLPIADMCTWRHCYAVQGHVQVDLVLGSGKYGAGFRADELTREDVGISYFGSGKDIRIVKAYYLDPDTGELQDEIERLRLMRHRTGRLTGMAACEGPVDDNTESTLERVARVWPKSTKALQWVELVHVLHVDMPGEYPAVGDLAAGVPADVKRAVEALSGQLARHGIEAANVRSTFRPLKGKPSGVRKGVKWHAIAQATTAPGHDRLTDPDILADDWADTGPNAADSNTAETEHRPDTSLHQSASNGRSGPDSLGGQRTGEDDAVAGHSEPDWVDAGVVDDELALVDDEWFDPDDEDPLDQHPDTTDEGLGEGPGSRSGRPPRRRPDDGENQL
ncbi:MAG: hypothetical protein AAF962_18950 [Actinomycetota bacterium]